MTFAATWLARHRFLIAFATLSLFMGISVGLAKVTTSLYAVQLGATGWWLGAIAAAQSVGILCTALPMGGWVERFGPRRLFMLGSLLGGMMYLVLPLVPHTAFLLGMTALTGLVMPTRFVSLQMIFMAMLQHIGERNAGWQRAAHMSGMFLLGPLLTAVVIQNVGHAGSFWCVALMFFLTIGLSQRVLHHPLPTPAQAPARGGTSTPGTNKVWGIFRHRQARYLGLLEAGIQSLNMYYAFFIVVIAVHQLQIPLTQASSLVAVQGCAFIVGLLGLGAWVERWGTRALGIGVTLVLLATSTLAFGQHLASLWLGGALLGLGLSVLEIRVLSQMSQLGTELGLGRMASLNAVAGPLGAMLGGLVGGSVGHIWGLQHTFLVFVPVFAVLWWLGQQQPR